MLRFTGLFLVLTSTLSACNFAGGYTITKTTLDAPASTCTFVVLFPEDYAGPETGTQTFTVEPFNGPRLNSQLPGYSKTLEAGTWGIGPELRRLCGGYLSTPETGKAVAGS